MQLKIQAVFKKLLVQKNYDKSPNRLQKNNI